MSVDAPGGGTTGTGTAPRRRPASRFGALFTYTLRSCLPPRRLAMVVLACVGIVLFGLLAHALDYDRDRAFADVAADGILALLVPIAALVVGDAVLGAELRAGTFHFTWLSPAPSWAIVLARWLAGSLVAVVALVPATALAAIVAGSPSSAGPLAVAAAIEAVAYVALFVTVGCFTQRTAVWSLAIVFLVERLLGAALTGIAQLSPTWESRAIFVGLLDDPPDRLLREGIPGGWDAVGRLTVVTVVLLALAIWRMGRLRLSGPSD